MPMAFIDYWDAVDDQLEALYGIDTWEPAIEPDTIAEAQEDGDAPRTFALWFGEKMGLTKTSGGRVMRPFFPL